MPAWSHDGQSVIYTSTAASADGRPADGDNDIYRVPYNNKAGGDATPIAGASDPNFSEYYPALSPDRQPEPSQDLCGRRRGLRRS